MNDHPLIELATRKGVLREGLGYGAQRSQLAALATQLTGTSYLHAGEALDTARMALANHLHALPDHTAELDAF